MVDRLKPAHGEFQTPPGILALLDVHRKMLPDLVKKSSDVFDLGELLRTINEDHLTINREIHIIESQSLQVREEQLSVASRLRSLDHASQRVKTAAFIKALVWRKEDNPNVKVGLFFDDKREEGQRERLMIDLGNLNYTFSTHTAVANLTERLGAQKLIELVGEPDYVLFYDPIIHRR